MGPASLAKVLERGQITLPREIRRAAGIKPGDSVLIRATGPTTLEVKVLPQLTLEETFEMFQIDGPIDPDDLKEGWKDAAAEEVFSEGTEPELG